MTHLMVLQILAPSMSFPCLFVSVSTSGGEPSLSLSLLPRSLSFCLVDVRPFRSSFLHLRHLSWRWAGLSDGLLLLLLRVLPVRRRSRRLAARGKGRASGLQSELRLVGVGEAGRDLFLSFFFIFCLLARRVIAGAVEANAASLSVRRC